MADLLKDLITGHEKYLSVQGLDIMEPAQKGWWSRLFNPPKEQDNKNEM